MKVGSLSLQKILCRLSLIYLLQVERTHSSDPSNDLIHLSLHSSKADPNRLEERFEPFFPQDDSFIRTNNQWRKLSSNGDDSGTHFATIFVGNPTQAQILVISTESDYTAFPCTDKPNNEVDANGNIIPSYTYVYSKSDTFQSVICGQCYNDDRECDDKKATCLVSESYRDKSMWEAFEAKDMVYVGGAAVSGPLEGSSVAKDHGFPLMFGCQTLVRGWRMSDLADGIMGFSSKPTSFVYQMFKEKVLKRPAFSLCFGRKSSLHQEISSGSLTLGGFNPKHHASMMVFAENTMVGGASFSVHLRNVFLRVGGGESMKPYIPGMKIVKVLFDDEFLNSKEGGGVAVDSSTPYTLFSQQLSIPFKQAWKMATGTDFSYRKAKLTDAQVKALPTIIFQFKAFPSAGRPNEEMYLAGDLDSEYPTDILVAFPATHYMEYNSNTKMYRPRISFENTDGSVLGANMMQGHDVTFDLQHNRIGFAEAFTCVFDGKYEAPPGPTGFSYADDLFNGDVDDEMGIPKTNWGADDAFVTDDANFDKNGLSSEKFINENGSCDTMVCKAFVGVGYFFAVVAAWVIYKCANVKARVTEAFGTEEDINELQEIDFPDYEPEPHDAESRIDMQPLNPNAHI